MHCIHHSSSSTLRYTLCYLKLNNSFFYNHLLHPVTWASCLLIASILHMCKRYLFCFTYRWHPFYLLLMALHPACYLLLAVHGFHLLFFKARRSCCWYLCLTFIKSGSAALLCCFYGIYWLSVICKYSCKSDGYA